jgi:hypothetical protein
MRLLSVELTRFRSRRAIVLLLLAGVLLTALMASFTLRETRPVSKADQVAAQAQADREANQPWVRKELRRCENNPERYLGDQATAADCAESVLPKAEWYLYRETLSLADERRDSGLAVTVLLAGLLVVVGASFAGADWASGSMSNQLLFEPRRPRVWLGKAGAVFLGSLVFAALVLAAFWLALYIAAELRGIPTGATVQADIRWRIARGAVLVACGGLGGFALTMLLRHTVGTLAALFAYVVAGETLIALLPVDGIWRWSLANNVFAWLQDGTSVWDESAPCRRGGGVCPQEVFLSLSHAAVFLGVLLALVLALSVLSFRRRDIA